MTASCAGTYDVNSQYITSPNYPSNYGNGQVCTWKLEVPQGRRLKIKSFQYKFEGCCVDVLTIYDGYNSGSSQIASLNETSGTQENILSSSNSLFLHFKSDSSQTYQGFKLFYEFV